MNEKKPLKTPKAIRTEYSGSEEVIPVKFIRKNIKSWRLVLLTNPNKIIRVRDKNAWKLVF